MGLPVELNLCVFCITVAAVSLFTGNVEMGVAPEYEK